MTEADYIRVQNIAYLNVARQALSEAMVTEDRYNNSITEEFIQARKTITLLHTQLLHDEIERNEVTLPEPAPHYKLERTTYHLQMGTRMEQGTLSLGIYPTIEGVNKAKEMDSRCMAPGMSISYSTTLVGPTHEK